MPQEPQIDHAFFSAPLVDLVDTDLDKLSQPQLEAYLKRIREMRASKATMKAKTSQATKPSTSKSSIDLNSLL